METIKWPDFLSDVMKKAPRPVKHEGVQANIHPNEHGAWIWHVSVVFDHTAAQREWLESFMAQIGEGPIELYEGGVVKRVLHATTPLTKDEIENLPKEAMNLVQAFERGKLN